MQFKKWLLSEVDEDDIEEIRDILDDIPPENLPFNDIFRGNYRIAIPLEGSQLYELIRLLQNQGYTLNLDKGTATKTKKSISEKGLQALRDKLEVARQRGNKEEATRISNQINSVLSRSDKKTEIKIGKAIQRSGIGSEWLDFWSNYQSGEIFNQREHSVIISRHPVDVLRMSDFEDIESCHSQGGMYWKCAIAEAREGGIVAYLVDTNDIRGKDINSQDEIFYDEERDIRYWKGYDFFDTLIKPKARIRLRRFKHVDTNTNLAIPESRVYGASGDLAKRLKDAILNFPFGIEQMDFDDNDNTGEDRTIIRLSFEAHERNNPDDYRYFLEELKSVDENYNKYYAHVEQVFVKNGILTPSWFTKQLENLSKFEFDEDESEFRADMSYENLPITTKGEFANIIKISEKDIAKDLLKVLPFLKNENMGFWLRGNHGGVYFEFPYRQGVDANYIKKSINYIEKNWDELYKYIYQLILYHIEGYGEKYKTTGFKKSRIGSFGEPKPKPKFKQLNFPSF